MKAVEPDLTCSFLGLDLRNPLVLASGILGTSPELLERMASSDAGAVTSKSCGPDARTGHPNPIVLDWQGGLINAVGLTNPGIEKEIPVLKAAKKRLAEMGVPLIASIFAPSVEVFGEMAARISEAQPDLIEVNISCPNVADDFGTPFSGSPQTTTAVTAKVKENTSIPFTIKLSPNVPCIARIAQAAEAAGADAITAINTVPGMLIDARAAKPVLSNRMGGLSGWSIKPVALRCVAEIYQAVKIPVIGLGGVTSGLDAAEMIMAGAAAVGVGTALRTRGLDAFALIVEELKDFMALEGYKTLQSMKGLALRK